MNNNSQQQIEQQEGSSRNIFNENLSSLQKMKNKVELGIKNKEVWNENLLQNMISRAESYLENQYVQIIFLGLKESGKTTLLNSLLGDDISPQKISKPLHTQVIIQIGYRNDNLISITRCNPSTFKPTSSDDQNMYYSQNIKEIHSYIEVSLYPEANSNTLQANSSDEGIANNHSLKVFEIRVNSPYFHNFPNEIRSNIFLIDTPGIEVNERYQQQIFINSLKNISQNSQPSIKYYVWVTPLSDKNKRYEKTVFENVCHQLHLQEKNQQLPSQSDKSNKDLQHNNNSNPQINKPNFSKEEESKENNINQQKQSSNAHLQYDSQKCALIQQICNVIQSSQNINKSDQLSLVDSMNSKLSSSLKEVKLQSNLQSSEQEPNKLLDVFNSEINMEDDDFWVIDKSQAERDVMEVKLRNEQICFLRLQKIHRQLIVVFNSHEEENIFGEKNNSELSQQFQPKLSEYQEKYLSMLEKSLQKSVIKVSALPGLICQLYSKYKHDKIKEQEIVKKFFSSYKGTLKLKNEKAAKNILCNISYEQQQKQNAIGLETDLKQQNNSTGSSQNYLNADMQINVIADNYPPQIRASYLPNFERVLLSQLNELYDYKQMKKRLRIQEIIDKSSLTSKNVILNKLKRDRIELFVFESLPQIHRNHQQIIQTNLQNLYLSSLEHRKSSTIPKIEEIYSNHKSYQIFDKVEEQLNQAILDYFSESMQSLAQAMMSGDKFIETNKDGILYEINQIDPQLEEGIKSIIIDFKKRSLQDANNLVTSNLCLSLQQNISLLGQIVGTSSLFTGLGVVLERFAGKSLMGSGPLGLGVAVGLSVLSTIFFVSKRERKLQESQKQILEFFEKIEEEQQKIHDQLIQSYIKVYNEVILVISDYLKGITRINLKQLIDEQKNLHQQDKEINSSNIRHHSQFNDNDCTSSESDSEQDSEYEENGSEDRDSEIQSQFQTPTIQQSFLLDSNPEYQWNSQQKEQEFRLKILENSNNSLFYSQKSSNVQQYMSDLENTQQNLSPIKSRLSEQKEMENNQQSHFNLQKLTEENKFKELLVLQLNKQDLDEQFQDAEKNLHLENQDENEQDVFYSFSSHEND